MKRKILYLIFASVLILPLYQCWNVGLLDSKRDLSINVVWHKAYEAETAKNVLVGTKWYLNYLGAQLPKGCFDSIQIKNNVPFEFNISRFGFNETALNAWSHIIKTVKQTEYYKANKAIDIGRLIMLTLNSSWHYYKITGAEPKYKNAKKKYAFNEKLFAVQKGESCIAYGNRKIMIADGADLKSTAFIGLEITSDIEDENLHVEEFEFMEVMENGYFKFALYNTSGKLMHGSTKSLTDSGKPAKCLWCHEQNILPPFLAETNTNGHYTINEFKDILEGKMKEVLLYRSNLDREINMRKLQDHAYLEKLYISFMEPSAMRLSNEWKISINKIDEMLSSLEKHEHREFKILGELYMRNKVDEYASVQPIRVPDDARETSDYEPNFFK